ncbi:MAG: phosphatidylserine decarboxylase family protein [Deltaproteobacteria bacterium]|nr:phosphatidylserine decarboxylase family protein [Deltaproteobacteria bacterium]
MNYYIAREGWPFIGGVSAFFIILLTIGNIFFILPGLALLLFVAWFFRNPDRAVPEIDGAVVSPADGTVIAISSLPDGVKKISIFMSVFNVHVNRIPADGVVEEIKYNKGSFLVASREKASLDNEQNAVTIADSAGRRIKFVQIAGLVARRIVCRLKVGDRVNRGMRYGMIRFGSRLDLYLPDGLSLKISLKDKVRAGSTVIGIYG